jgi:hypothetical protein
MEDQSQAGNNPWAAHAAHNAQFFGGDGTPPPIRVKDSDVPSSTKDILAGINPEAMRAVVEESHRGLFGEELPGVSRAEEAYAHRAPLSPQEPRAHAPASEKEYITLPLAKARLLKQLAHTLEETAQHIRELLGGVTDFAAVSTTAHAPDEGAGPDADHVIEGVFNGHCMIGPDGKQYNVPANYASKSKLVEGDMLKLIILPSGKFIYKQIGPIDRDRLVGTLVLGTEKNEYYVEKDNRRWRVLHASATYYKGQPGDETIILVPKEGESAWAAVENIVSRS